MNTNPTIRVMQIIARLNIGGSAMQVVLITDQLGPPQFDTRLVCGHIGPHEGDMAYLAKERGIVPIYIAELGRELSPLRDLVTLVKLWRLMRSFRPDIVHTHTAKAGFVGRMAAWLARVPVRVHTFHGHVFHSYFSPLKTRLFLWLERFSARLSDRLITISPGLKDELVNVYRIAPAEKVEVVPLGMDLKPFTDPPRHKGIFRTQFGIPPDVPLIGIVGRIVPVKNHDLFLAMAERVYRKMPDAQFVIIGDGEGRANIEAKAATLGLPVIFAGWLHDLVPAYNDMDLLVISSNNEGTPVSAIEALAAGVPVVSTAVGGVPDLLEKGMYGRLVPPGDPDALAAAALQALTDSLQVTEAIQDTILARYGVSRLAADHADLYRRLLAAKQGKPHP